MAKPIQLDLTEGSVVKRLIRFSLPLLATGLLQSLYSIVDTVVAGQVVGNSAISAISTAGQVVMMVTHIAIGLTTGGTVLLSQYYGSRDHESRKSTAGTFFTFIMLLGAILSVLIFVFAKPILTFLKAPAYDESCDYLLVSSFGVFFTFGYNALSSILRSTGNSKQPLYFIAAATVINIVLDLWFVIGLGWGVKGTAYATVASQFTTFAAALYFVLKNREFYGFSLSNMRIKLQKLKKILKIGIPTALQMMVGGISWMVVLVFINKYDVDVAAAAGTANKIREVCVLCISSVATGASTMVAQNLGAGKFDRAKKTLHITLLINVCIAAVLLVFVELAAPYLASIFTSEENAISYATTHLRIESISFFFYAGFMSYNALAIGAGNTTLVFFNSFLNCIGARVILVFALEKWLGLTGIYWACAFAPGVSVPVGMLYARSNRWQKRLLDESAGPEGIQAAASEEQLCEPATEASDGPGDGQEAELLIEPLTEPAIDPAEKL